LEGNLKMENITMIIPKNPVGRPHILDGCTSHLHIRVNPTEKACWVRAAQGNGGLSAWVKDILTKAAAGLPEPNTGLGIKFEWRMKMRENGPWTADEWDDGVLVLQSKDYHHDAALKITGDFSSPEVKRKYIEEICARMNAANPMSNVQIEWRPLFAHPPE
jgi:hypothetical protein